MTGLIARHEIRRLAGSAQSWVVAAALAALAGWLFLSRLERWLAVQDELALQDHSPGLAGFLGTGFLAPLAIVLSLVAPLYAMRSFAEDRRDGVWPLWQSAPVSPVALVLGRFLGIGAVLCAFVALGAAMVASLAPFVALDLATLASGATGLALCTLAAGALGLWCSSLVRAPLAGATVAIAAVLLAWLVGSARLDAPVLASLPALSPGTRLSGFFQGVPASGDAAYFVLAIALFLALTAIRLDALRHAGGR